MRPTPDCFDGMSGCVSKIEYLAYTLFIGISIDHRQFCFDRVSNQWT